MQAYRWTAERVLRELNSAPGGLCCNYPIR